MVYFYSMFLFTINLLYVIIFDEVKYRGDKMNQILDYNPGPNPRGSSNSDKIVRVFAILLIIFALVLCGVGAYGKYKNSQESKNKKEETKANIELVQNDNDVVIKVTHDKSIEKLIYSWNTSSEKTEKNTGNTSMEITVPMPAGENVLHVKVIDIDGVETTAQKTFTSEQGVDIISPVIKIETQGEKFKIVATDETSLDFLTYRWNDEEETKVEASEDNKKEISVEIEIKKGKNDLTIVAVDSSNNTTTETKTFKGVTKPEIVAVVSEDQSQVDIKVSHEKGIQSIVVELNGSDPIEVDLGGETPTDASFPIPLSEGENKIKITATSVEGIPNTEETTFTYTPAVQENPSTNGNEPKISMIQSEDGKLVSVRVEYEQGLKSVSLLYNEQEIEIDIGNDNPAQASFDLELLEGQNRIVITSVGTDDSEGVLDKEFIYTPQ